MEKRAFSLISPHWRHSKQPAMKAARTFVLPLALVLTFGCVDGTTETDPLGGVGGNTSVAGTGVTGGGGNASAGNAFGGMAQAAGTSSGGMVSTGGGGLGQS